ncbi:sigma-E factor negative regulatory protein, partial [Melaminivora alkalimesophila]
MKDEHDLLHMREQLSAMADGELQGEGFAQAMRHAGHQEAQACWQVYHLIGDTLRQGQAVRPMTDPALLQRLRAQMASEAPSRTLATAPLQSVAPAASAA